MILTKPSLALLNTDFNAASYWVTNPNNTYRNNVAAGSSNGYGFWYQVRHDGSVNVLHSPGGAP